MEIKVNQLKIKINTDRNKVYENSIDRIWNSWYSICKQIMMLYAGF